MKMLLLIVALSVTVSAHPPWARFLGLKAHVEKSLARDTSAKDVLPVLRPVVEKKDWKCPDKFSFGHQLSMSTWKHGSSGAKVRDNAWNRANAGYEGQEAFCLKTPTKNCEGFWLGWQDQGMNKGYVWHWCNDELETGTRKAAGLFDAFLNSEQLGEEMKKLFEKNGWSQNGFGWQWG